MIPDRYAKTVRIPVRIENGKPAFFYDGPLPKLREGAIGDLVIGAHAVLEGEVRERFEVELDKQIVPSGATVLAHVRDPEPRSETVRLNHEAVPGLLTPSGWLHFVPIELLEPLYLQLRSTKKARLRSCRCAVPTVGREARSLNEAYSIISQAYETWRRSHSGNVFRKVFIEDWLRKEPPTWRPLDDLRSREEAEVERLLFDERPRGGRTPNLGRSTRAQRSASD